VSETFGQVIRKARREEEYSQRELAKLIGVDYTYLSKLENDHAGYPPSQQVIESLAGRLSSDDQKVFKELVQKYQQMPILLRRMKDNPNFAKKVISEATKLDEQE
jgi:transcriptional regulator with XRE-family HTH domain